jgi:hypothetical protein
MMPTATRDIDTLQQQIADLQKALELARAAERTERAAAQLARESAATAWRVAFGPVTNVRKD